MQTVNYCTSTANILIFQTNNNAEALGYLTTQPIIPFDPAGGLRGWVSHAHFNHYNVQSYSKRKKETSPFSHEHYSLLLTAQLFNQLCITFPSLAPRVAAPQEALVLAHSTATQPLCTISTVGSLTWASSGRSSLSLKANEYDFLRSQHWISVCLCQLFCPHDSWRNIYIYIYIACFDCFQTAQFFHC